VACLSCPSGKWSDAGSKSCPLMACSNSQVRNATTGVCQDCPEGTFLSVPSGSNPTCARCSLGSTSSIGDTSCRRCARNTFGVLNSAGNPICRACPFNQYQPQTGMASCVSCASASTTPPEPGCIQRACLSNQYRDPSTGDCIALPLGVISTGNNFDPAPAPLGFTTVPGTNTTIPCPSNYYGVRVSLGSLTASTCQKCPEGSTSARGSSECTRPCDAGFYRNASSVCTRCPAGWYNARPTDLGIAACIPCRTGTTTPTDGATQPSQCTVACPPGTFTYGAPPNRCTSPFCNGKFCPTVCRPGLYLNSKDKSCQRCPPGTFMPEYNSEPECRPCPVAPPERDGAFACVGCNAGSYFNGTGCSLCPNGMFSGQGAESVLECSIAPCGAGQFRNRQTLECEDCPVGTFSSAPNNADVCTACPKASVQPLTGQSSCTLCTNDLLPSENRTMCLPCTGPSVGVFNSSCVRCPLGFEAVPSKLSGSNVCVACNTSTYSNETTDFKCAYCPAGSIPDADRRSCTLCSLGSVPNADKTGCTRCLTAPGGGVFEGACLTTCPANTASSRRGAYTLCQNCPAGTCSYPGTTTCSTCPPSSCGLYYQRIKGNCVPCPANHWAPRPGQCLPCDKGKNAPSGEYVSRFCSGSSCDFCKSCSGHVSSDGICIDCNPGEYFSTGNFRCERCAANYFSKEWPDIKRGCSRCPAGTGSLWGATQCAPGCSYFQDCRASFNALKISCTDGGRKGLLVGNRCWTCARGFIFDSDRFVLSGGTELQCRDPFKPADVFFGYSTPEASIDGFVAVDGFLTRCPAGSFPNVNKDGCIQCNIGFEPVDGKCAFCRPGYGGVSPGVCARLWGGVRYSRGRGTKGLALNCPAFVFPSLLAP
jgi:hypothetical protein